MMVYSNNQCRAMVTIGRETFHVRTSLRDDIGQQGGSYLLGLEMAGLDEEDVGMTKPTVIVHLTCEVGIGT